MILVIDNYDSFVHNLARYFRLLGAQTTVVRNDQISLDQIKSIMPSHIVFSPGPCTPNEAGMCIDIVNHFDRDIPIIGVCLGHQAIAQAYGAKIIKSGYPMHGKSSLIEHDEHQMFAGLPSPLKVGRYHSLVISEDTLPSELSVTARTIDGTIMAIAHKELPVWGVQFHPESVLTEHGMEIIRNFLDTPCHVLSTRSVRRGSALSRCHPQHAKRA